MKFNKIALSLFAAGSSLLAIDSVTNLSVGTPHNSGTVTNDSTIDFTWTPPEGVAKYYYKLDTNSTNYDFVSAGSYDVLPSSTETSLEVTAPASGDYYLHIAAVDGSDGTSAPKIVQVTSSIDLDAGTVTINPTAGSITTDTNTITLSGSETGTIYYTVNGDTPDTNSSVYVTPLTLGVGATVKAILKDTAGNVQATASESTYTITNNPTITTAAGAAIDGQTISTTNTEAVTGLDVSGTDLSKYQYSIDSDSGHTPVGDMDTNIDISSLSTGQHTVYVRGGDDYNYQTTSSSVTFTVDNTAPSNLKALVDSVEADENNASTVTFADNFTFTLSSNEGTIKYTTDGTTPTKTVGTTYTSAVTTTKSVTTGSTLPVVLKMVSYDTAGNISPVTTVNFTIDKEAPTLTMPTTQPFASSIDVAISSDDSDATIYYLVSNSATTTASNIKNNGKIGTTAKVGQNPSTQQDDGNYKYLHAIAVDTVGNGDSDSAVQTVEFTYSDTVVTLNLTGVDEDSTIATSSANGATATTQLTVSGENFTYYKYKFNDSNLSGETAVALASVPTINLTTGLSDGNNTLYIGVDTETSGDFNSTTKSLSFIVDNTAPSVPSLTGRVFQNSLDVDLVKPADADYLLYKLNDGNYTQVSASTSVTIDANTTISLKSKDLIGNESNVTSADFEIGDLIELAISSGNLSLQAATNTTQTGTVVVENTGTGAATIADSNITIGGVDFNITSNSCTNVPANQTCDIVVSFTPTSKGAVTDQLLTITYNGSNSSELNTTVSGLGLGATPSLLATTLSDISINEDNGTTSYDLNVTDLDGDELNITIDTNNSDIITVSKGWEGMVLQSDYDSLDFNLSTVENANGIVKITLTLNDGDFNTTSTFDINVTAVNDAPVLVQPSDVNKSEDFTDFNITLSANDVDDTNISYSVESDNSNVVDLNVSNNVLMVSSKENMYGDTNITVTVTDGENNATQSFMLSVAALDDPVSLEAIANQTKVEDANSFSLELNATDIDGDNITYSVSSSDTSIATVSQTDGNISIDLVENANGLVTIEVNATANGVVATQSFELNVTAVDDAPTFDETISAITKLEDADSFTLDINVTDVDGDTVTYSATSANEQIATVSMQDDILTITPVENQNGDLNITVTATANGVDVSQVFDLNITAVDDAPVIATISPERFTSEDNTTRTIDVNATDIENDTITFDVNSSDTSIVTADINASGTVTLTPQDGNGTAVVTVTAITADANTTSTFTVTIKDTSVSFEKEAASSSYDSDTNTTTTEFALDSGTLELNENDNGKISAVFDGTNDINLTVDVVGTDINVDANGSLTISLSDNNVSKELSVNADGTVESKFTTDDNKTTELDISIAVDIAPTVNNDGSVSTVFTSNSKEVNIKIKSDGTMAAPTITGAVLPTNDLPAGTKATAQGNEVKFEFSLPATLEFN